MLATARMVIMQPKTTHVVSALRRSVWANSLRIGLAAAVGRPEVLSCIVWNPPPGRPVRASGRPGGGFHTMHERLRRSHSVWPQDPGLHSGCAAPLGAPAAFVNSRERLRRSVGTRTPPADTASTDYREPTPKTLVLGPSLSPNPNVGTQSLAYMHVAKTGIAAMPNDPHLDGVMYRLSLHFV